MPPGGVRSVHVFQKFGGGVKVLLDIEDDKEGRLKRFNLNAEFISEVLLHYCAGLNIPVAKEADNYLEVIGNNLALSQKSGLRKSSPNMRKNHRCTISAQQA